jgi:hypothetical protein
VAERGREEGKRGRKESRRGGDLQLWRDKIEVYELGEWPAHVSGGALGGASSSSQARFYFSRFWKLIRGLQRTTSSS